MSSNRRGARSVSLMMLLCALGSAAAPSHAQGVAAAPGLEARVDTAETGRPRVELVQEEAQRVQLVAKALPAVSVDGKRVAIAVIGEDGARGDPNLSVQVRDVDSDAMVWHLPILEVDKGLPTTLGAKINRANAQLDATKWTQFTTAAAPAPPISGDLVDREVSSLRVAELTVALAGTHLTVRDANGRAVISRRVPGWAAAPSAGPGGMRCHNPPRLADAHLHVPSRTLLLRVAFFGSDACWEPDSRWHTVRLPKR